MKSMIAFMKKEWMEQQEIKGFCFKKYKENILLEGVSLSDCKEGDLPETVRRSAAEQQMRNCGIRYCR